MASHEISLKWKGYQSNILSNVKELFRDEGLSDVTLVSDGQSFKAHKVILSANSAVFRTIFQQNPHKDPIIVLHDINAASLRTLLTFMYNGEVNVTEESLPLLLKTADNLRICGLSTECEQIKDDEKPAPTTQPKKRKKSEHEDNNNKVKKVVPNPKTENAPKAAVNNDKDIPDIPVVPKVEPIDSPLTDYSGDNTTDTDIALLEDALAKKPENVSRSSCLQQNVKQWISELNGTQPCLNASSVDKTNGNDTEDDSEGIEIDKEVETVLQSGTMVESLNITTENLNEKSNEAHTCKDKNPIFKYTTNTSFPCPFCPRVYNSWGYRRRHVKSRHVTNRLSCRWCVSVLSSTGAWYTHATRAHGVAHEEARNSLVVMVEAHAVLKLNEPSVAQLLGQIGMAEGECDDKTA